eukprot:TRINITY_DN50124_c0_g1_i7.p1 TRINITY_DN50124_c0_g1~~TRINITY_DN50124_c0_g1_i7.p1  ORF type:complete len:138 (+),score=22.40 TRINITY_DN50124_c0_g1_i7:94-507(+)
MDMFFFFKQKTAYEMLRSLVGSEMCIRDRLYTNNTMTLCTMTLYWVQSWRVVRPKNHSLPLDLTQYTSGRVQQIVCRLAQNGANIDQPLLPRTDARDASVVADLQCCSKWLKQAFSVGAGIWSVQLRRSLNLPARSV